MTLVMGIDGGGSRTKAVVTDLRGTVLGKGDAGPSNIHACTRDAVLLALRESSAAALCAAGASYEDICQVVLGMAGAGRESDRLLYEQIAGEIGLCCRPSVTTDAEIALDAATRGLPGVILIAGTGSACFGRTSAGELVRSGGYGHVLGDEGSGYWVGLQALKACLLAKDGRGPETLMQNDVLEQIGATSVAQIPSLLRQDLDRPKIARLAHMVGTYAYEHDEPVAHGIMALAARELAGLVGSVLRQMQMCAPVFLTGGMFDLPHFAAHVIAEVCLGGLAGQVELARIPPVAGAAWRAATLAGGDLFDFSHFEGLGTSAVSGSRPESQTVTGALPVTERRNPRSSSLSRMSAREIADTMNSEDMLVPIAVSACRSQIATAIDWASQSVQSGGRIVYVGAGTSGRLGFLDASECPPTFGVPYDMVITVMAGGPSAIAKAVEGAEDDASAGASQMETLRIGPKDTVVGIAASGSTPFTIGALESAGSLGARTVAITAVPGSKMGGCAELTICTVVGPEVLTGSTRLKSASAHKMVLNMISTGAMVRSGKAFSNLMVDVKATNEKLRRRAVRIVCQASGVSAEIAEDLFEEASMDVKQAVTMAITGKGRDRARWALDKSGGFVDKAVALLEGESV